jgi:hypothetical protein
MRTADLRGTAGFLEFMLQVTAMGKLEHRLMAD